MNAMLTPGQAAAALDCPPMAAGEQDEAVMQLLAAVERIDLMMQGRLHLMQSREDDRLDMQVMLLDPGQLDAACAQARGYPAWMDKAEAGARPSLPATWAAPAHSRLGLLCSRFGLDAVSCDVLLLAALPWLEPRYGVLLSYLQGDATRRAVSLALASTMLAVSPLAGLRLRTGLTPHSPLFRHGLVRAADDRKNEGLPWMERGLRIDERIFQYLLGQDELAPALASCCRWLAPSELPVVSAEWAGKLVQAVQQDAALVFVRGMAGGRGTAVATAAAGAGRRVLALNLARLPADDFLAIQTLQQALREARLYDAWLLLRGVAGLRASGSSAWGQLDELLKQHAGPVVCLADTGDTMAWLAARPQHIVDMAPRSVRGDAALLRARLASMITESDLDVEALVRRFHLSADTLEPMLAEADLHRRRRGLDLPLAQADLHAAMRVRAQQDFGKLAQRLEPRRSLDDLIIAAPLRAQLAEIQAAIRQREALLEAGFERKLSYGLGISALFHGDSGTGKTMVAECLAHALGVDLIKVDLSTVVNKYIGETEKNLARVFDVAAADAGVLFFDEADALFGKRSETKDAQDRHANIEVSYLLQRLESYPGLVILATNNRSHLDTAFSRRITFITRFSFPDAALRERMWRAIWPEGVVLASDIDFAALAHKAEMSGGNIRNAALLAAWLARDAGSEVSKAHLDLAVRRELAKIGRVGP